MYMVILGQILQFGFDEDMDHWLFCHGQELLIKDHAGLFSLLGTYFGGDGIHTFMLPDLRIRDPENGLYYKHGSIMPNGVMYLESRINIDGEYPDLDDD